jgi:hypothetical protein
MKSAIQKLNKSTVFHQRNRYGRNLQIMARSLCPILTRISAVPDQRRALNGVPGESWLRRNRTSETGIVDYEVSRLATKRLQVKNESQIASACPIFSTHWSLLSTLIGCLSWIFELLSQNRCIIFTQ